MNVDVREQGHGEAGDDLEEEAIIMCGFPSLTIVSMGAGLASPSAATMNSSPAQQLRQQQQQGQQQRQEQGQQFQDDSEGVQGTSNSSQQPAIMDEKEYRAWTVALKQARRVRALNMSSKQAS